MRWWSLQDGQVVAERYYAGMTAGTRHLLMSVSKSILGLRGRGAGRPGPARSRAPVTAYVPEVSGSGYAGASIRDLLDMRTGVAFRETYTALDAEVRVMERSMGWRPALPGDPEGAYPYLATLGSAGPHGGEFSYRSADSDMLGWACERASGIRMADLISALIWQPIGAEATPRSPAIRSARPCTTAGSRPPPATWPGSGRCWSTTAGRRGASWCPRRGWTTCARQCLACARRSRAPATSTCCLGAGTGASSGFSPAVPASPVMVCLGIHGQLIYADHAARTVVVKLSSWPDAQNTGYLLDTLRACAALAARLSAGRVEETTL